MSGTHAHDTGCDEHERQDGQQDERAVHTCVSERAADRRTAAHGSLGPMAVVAHMVNPSRCSSGPRSNGQAGSW
ncbi:hypothetical protein [Streptomyces melanogenes]|uniref:hypothetical protein n=1 Tax=Streptomyces melanogenes TaxID=67326 RepID=UPI00167EDC2E|nr:hypothetical protein [Streptomyces melanogenes]